MQLGPLNAPRREEVVRRQAEADPEHPREVEDAEPRLGREPVERQRLV